MTVPPVTGGLASPAVPRPQDRDLQKAAEGFERLLVGQLTKTLVDSAFPASETASAATGAYREVIPQALADALVQGGGIGLGRVLTEGRS
jgi:Rod binding domain-containing protein